MISIKGLDDLQKMLAEAEKALNELNEEIGTVSFDPEDPESIRNAIRAMENAVDSRLAKHSGNDIIGPLIESTKEKFRSGILKKAAEARLKGTDEEK